MTVIVGIQTESEIVVACDSCITLGDHIAPPTSTFEAPGGKAFRTKDLFIGVSGWGAWKTYLAEFARDDENKKQIAVSAKTSHDVFMLIAALLAWMRKAGLYDAAGANERSGPFASLDSTFLIASPHGLWCMVQNLDVRPQQRFVAIGAGDDYATGAWHALCHLDGGGEMPNCGAPEAARIAVEAACRYNTYCQLPVELVTFKRK